MRLLIVGTLDAAMRLGALQLHMSSPDPPGRPMRVQGPFAGPSAECFGSEGKACGFYPGQLPFWDSFITGGALARAPVLI